VASWAPTLVGLIAGTCSTAAFVPQVVKIWREGDTHAISTRMYGFRVFGFALRLIYGFALGSLPLMIFNTLSILLGGTILWLKVFRPGESHE
jgi:MtN3 and saliva related transmembrane protein